MKKILIFILAIGLIASFSACNNNESTNSGDNVSQSGNQNENQNGNQNENQNGNQNGETNNQPEGIVLTIEGNGTTGYTWHATGYDSEMVKIEELGTEPIEQGNNENVVSGENEVSGEATQIVGTPSLFKFKITGIKEGSTTIIFDYYRSWEGISSTIETRQYLATIDDKLNVVVVEKIEEPDIPVEDDYTASAEMEALVNDLITRSEVQFAMPMASKILLANAPTFVGLSEELFSQYVVDSVVYEPMISPATSSMCIVKLSDDADVATLKQTVLQNSNPAKWVCTGAEQVLVMESGRYIMLVMSTPENCEALKTAFTEHFGAENVGEVLTKEGVSVEGEDFQEVL